MAKLKPLRVEIRAAFSELYGVDYGMTIGLLFDPTCAVQELWFDVVAMTRGSYGSGYTCNLVYELHPHVCAIHSNEVA